MRTHSCLAGRDGRDRWTALGLLVPAAVTLMFVVGFAAPATAGLIGEGPAFHGGEGAPPFHGVIEALPEGGLIGDWTVSGITVHVGEGTEIDEENGPAVVGAEVLVFGTEEEDGSITASEIKVKEEEHEPDECEVEGLVESMPDGGFVGDWVIAGITVHVTEETMVNEEHGAAEVGAFVEAEGFCEEDGSITARKVKVEEVEAEECEVEGAIESMPAEGLIGDWVVAGITVHVTEETMVNQEHGPAEVGAFVEVEGACEEDGSITAWKVKVEGEDDGDDDGEGEGHPEAKSFAVLHLSPTEEAPPEAEGVALIRLFVREGGLQEEDLKVCVEHLLADTIYDVVVDGTNAGAILTNPEGEGCLFLSSRDVPGAEPLPGELRPVNELGQVEVSDPDGIIVLAGNFADAKWNEWTHPGTDFVSVALLRDAAGMVIGMLQATASEDEQELELRAWGLEPLAAYAVVLDGSELATLIADEHGNLEGEWSDPAEDDDLPLPGMFLPVSGLLHAELQDADGNVVAAGDFGEVAPAAASASSGSTRRRFGGH